MSGSAIRRGSGWCGSKPWRKKPPAISKACWRWPAPRSTPASFARAREVLEPLIAAPTQRVAMLMAEIERTEHGDSGRARAWTLRAVRALHDPVWTADGYVSDRWRPVSPVTGRLDAFQWQTPLAALPSDKAVTVESTRVQRRHAGAARARRPREWRREPDSQPCPSRRRRRTIHRRRSAVERRRRRHFAARRPRSPGIARPAIPPVIPIVRAPDDPGIDDDPLVDEFAESDPAQGQAGGWRGFLARWVG